MTENWKPLGFLIETVTDGTSPRYCDFSPAEIAQVSYLDSQ